MKLSIGKKIGLGYALALVLMAGGSLLAFLELEQIRVLQERMKDVRFPTTTALGNLTGQMNQTQSKAREYILVHDNPELAERSKRDWGEAWSQIESEEERLKVLSAFWELQENRERLAKALEALSRVRGEQEHAMQMATGGEKDAMFRAGLYESERVTTVTDPAKEQLGAVIKSNSELVTQEVGKLTADANGLIWTLVVATGAALLISSVIGYLISRQITVAAKRVLERSEAVATGDLTGNELAVQSRDEIGELAKAVDRMQGSLRAMLSSVSENAQRVASASEEISASATQQAQGAETQKSQTEQVATAMQEMSATVLEISDNSNRAAEAAQKAEETARQGGGIVEETLTIMRGIAGSVGETAKKVHGLGMSSDQIGEIIAVIDDIADQTNLLALNAAIEAARAGEQGADSQWWRMRCGSWPSARARRPRKLR